MSEATGERPLSSEVTAELMRRYDRQGPRYTSYPTAVEFAEGIDDLTGNVARPCDVADHGARF